MDAIDEQLDDIRVGNTWEIEYAETIYSCAPQFPLLDVLYLLTKLPVKVKMHFNSHHIHT